MLERYWGLDFQEAVPLAPPPGSPLLRDEFWSTGDGLASTILLQVFHTYDRADLLALFWPVRHPWPEHIPVSTIS